MRDEVIESFAKLSPKGDEEITNFNEKNIACKRQNFYILLAF